MTSRNGDRKMTRKDWRDVIAALAIGAAGIAGWVWFLLEESSALTRL